MNRFVKAIPIVLTLMSPAHAQTLFDDTKLQSNYHITTHKDLKKETYMWNDRNDIYVVDLYSEPVLDNPRVLPRNRIHHYDVSIRTNSRETLFGTYTSFFFIGRNDDSNGNNIQDPALGYAICKNCVTEFIFVPGIETIPLQNACEANAASAFKIIEDSAKIAIEISIKK